MTNKVIPGTLVPRKPKTPTLTTLRVFDGDQWKETEAREDSRPTYTTPRRLPRAALVNGLRRLLVALETPAPAKAEQLELGGGL